jgi:hypothetical protein
MMSRRLLVPALLVPFWSLAAQQPQGSSPPAAATIAAKAKAAKLNQAHAKAAAINGKKFNITPADFSGIKKRDDLRGGVFLGVLDNEAGATEDVSLPPGRYNLYLTESAGGWEAYAEQNGKVIKAKRTVERPDTPANMEPVFSRGSGCWWLNLFITGIYVCW